MTTTTVDHLLDLSALIELRPETAAMTDRYRNDEHVPVEAFDELYGRCNAEIDRVLDQLHALIENREQRFERFECRVTIEDGVATVLNLISGAFELGVERDAASDRRAARAIAAAVEQFDVALRGSAVEWQRERLVERVRLAADG